MDLRQVIRPIVWSLYYCGSLCRPLQLHDYIYIYTSSSLCALNLLIQMICLLVSINIQIPEIPNEISIIRRLRALSRTISYLLIDWLIANDVKWRNQLKKNDNSYEGKDLIDLNDMLKWIPCARAKFSEFLVFALLYGSWTLSSYLRCSKFKNNY